MNEKLETSRNILAFLEQEGVNPTILGQIRSFLDTYPMGNAEGIPTPRYAYYGKEIWEQALTAILCGNNLLLAGGKMAGKNRGGNRGIAVWSAMQGASVVRVHDVKETFQALKVVETLG